MAALLIELMTYLLVIYIGHHIAKRTCKCVAMRASLSTSRFGLHACMHVSICACNTLAPSWFSVSPGLPQTHKDVVAMHGAQ